MVNTKVNLGGLEMATPVATASGTFGYGTEYIGAVDYAKLGAVTAKGIRLEPWPGNAMPRHCEVPGGLVNAIGLQGTGVEQFLSITVPWYREESAATAGRSVPLIANIWGGSVDEYAEVARRLGDAVDAIELNVSCPNVKSGGHTFGQDPAVLAQVVRATRLPILAMGGVFDARDAIEFLLAGATAVAVGTATFSDPGVVAAVHDGIVDYCIRHGFSSVTELTGNLAE